VKNEAGRAPRFALRLPLRYRGVGERHWREGQTQNISRTGVLFFAENLMRIDTPVEMRFALPVAGARRGVACRGRIVRIVPAAEGRSRPALAATIAAYRFVRRHAMAA
jgi:hypothetical protein